MIKNIVVTIGECTFECLVAFDYKAGHPAIISGHPDEWIEAVPEEFTLNAFDVLDEDKSYKADYLIDAIEDDIILAIKKVL